MGSDRYNGFGARLAPATSGGEPARSEATLASLHCEEKLRALVKLPPDAPDLALSKPALWKLAPCGGLVHRAANSFSLPVTGTGSSWPAKRFPATGAVGADA